MSNNPHGESESRAAEAVAEAAAQALIKVADEAAAAVVKVAGDVAVTKSDIAKIQGSLERIEKAVFLGNGTPSLLLKVDRLEQTQIGRRKHYWLIYAAILTLIFTQIGDWVKGLLTPKTPAAIISITPPAPTAP